MKWHKKLFEKSGILTIEIFRKMKLIRTILATVAMFVSTACSFAQSNDTKSYVKHIDSQEFRTEIFDFAQENTWKFKGNKPCIVDFYATWCGPCRSISPYLDELSVKYKDQINIYKVDVDKNKELAQAFGAHSIPLLIFIPKTGEPQSNRGALPKSELERAIMTVLLK